MSSSDLVALTIAERMTSAVNDGNLDLLDEILSEDIIYHGEPSHVAADHWSYKGFIEALREAFPDLTITPDHVDATTTDIAIIYTISGTHEGKFLGLEPTGRHVSVRGMQIVRLESGKVVERWGSSDDMLFFRQLSAMG